MRTFLRLGFAALLLLGFTCVLQGSSAEGEEPLTGITAISAGSHHTCAVTKPRDIKCWGGRTGVIRNQSVIDSSTPQSVNGLSESMASVSAGNGYTCALTVEGGVKCWGRNDIGQLGIGTNDGPVTCDPVRNLTCHSTPTDVRGLTTGITAIDVGSFAHACALTAMGGVKC
jgi:alpha-tubulin suppressor-like RCC1 family protein